MLRKISTQYGDFSYHLERKRIKNLNLRVNREGEIRISIPMRCPAEQADDMVRRKAKWLYQVLASRKEEVVLLPPMPKQEVCWQILMQAVKNVYPLVEQQGIAFPQVKLRNMKSQWGNCHWTQGYITLNTALARCPVELQEYVALHELVHFLHHDHSVLFYRAMDERLPDWREKRAELKRYRHALMEEEK